MVHERMNNRKLILREKLVFVVANKLNRSVLNVGKIQEEEFESSGGDERKNNDGVGN